MTTDPIPGDRDLSWEPPLAGNETEQLLGALDRLRTTFRWKADDLDADGLATTLGRSSLTIGGLLKHLAFVEESSLHMKVTGEPPGEPWRSADWETDPPPHWATADDSPEELYALYDAAVATARSRVAALVADGGLDQPVELTHPDTGERASLRRLVCDLVEEYGRHTGHADLLREEVDGRVGEDPPSGWRPSSNADAGVWGPS